MPKVAVAYENSAEARRKLKALKPLRWHRTASGLEAKGARGKYVLVQRSPDRRHGVFPWSLRQGGAKGVEIKVGGFDLVAQGKEFAVLFDHGLCGAPPQPEGVYRGTVAGEDRQYDAYKYEVAKALSKMQVPDTVYRQAHVNQYLEDMAKAGVDANITAAVIAGTVRHSHNHDCPERHVEMNEAGEARRRKRAAREAARPGPNVIIGYERAADGRLGDGQFEIYPSSRGWSAEWHPSELSGHQPAPSQSLFAPAGDASINGAGSAVRKFLENKFGKNEGSDIFYNLVWQRGGYPSGYGPEALLRASRNEGAGERGARENCEPTDDEQEYVERLYSDINRARIKYEDHPTEANLRKLRGYEEELADITAPGSAHAGEAKKRLPQPDPSTGYFITHSSLTRDLWLMHENTLVARSADRGELLKKAEQLSSGASEGRRPKG